MQHANKGRWVPPVVLMVVAAGAVQAWGAEERIVAPIGAGNSNVTAALAKGTFNCGIIVVEPPGGSGEPEGNASISFSEYMGVSATNLSAGISIGTGEGLDPICQTLAEQTSSRVAALGCAAGPIRIFEGVGGNFTQKSWIIEVICVNDLNRVVGAVGSLLRSIVTAPVAQQSIRRTSAHSLDSNEADILRYRSLPVERLP